MAEEEERLVGSKPEGSGTSKYQPRYDHSYAIVIGIDHYRDSNLRPLGNAEDDARNFADVVSQKPYDFQVTSLLGEDATKTAITRALKDVTKKSHLDDRVIFYFAGHGYLHKNRRGFEIGYLACADTDPDDPFDGLEFREVKKLSEFSEAKHIAFILDACYSGQALGLTRSAMPAAAVQEYMLHRAYQVLTAGGVETVSDVRSMTGELVKVLGEGLPGQEEAFTFSHLGQHIHDVIHNQSRGNQTPIFGFLEGSSKGQMVLTPPVLTDSLPGQLHLGLTDPNARMRYFAIAEAEKYLADPELGEKVRAVLEEMQYDDDDREVRRRAGEALRNAPQEQLVKDKPVLFEKEEKIKEPSKSVHQTLNRTGSKPAAHDPILDILPQPFEWCDIPAGQVTLEEDAGTFEVKPFKLAKYPITYAQFQVFVDSQDGFIANRWWSDMAGFWIPPAEPRWIISNHPRESVSWYHTVAFCRWLSYRVGYEVRLPTEWEWQWAAQGADSRQYPWGNEYIQGYANCNEIASGIKGGVYLEKTTPVDNYPQGASPFGVMDMAGNVWEWCLNEYDKPGNLSTSGDARRTLRGGSWYGNGYNLRAAYRDGDYPSNSDYNFGFRCARSD